LLLCCWNLMLRLFVYHALFFISVLMSQVALVQAQPAVKNLRFDRLTVEDGLSQGTINTMMQDKQGFIWLATEHGVDIYDGYRIRPLPGPDGDFNNFGVYNLLQDKDGLVWIDVYGKGLYTYHPATDEYQVISSHKAEDKSNDLNHILEGDDGKIWLAKVKSVGFYDKDSGQYQEVLDLGSELTGINKIYQIHLAGDVLYIATRVGVFAYQVSSKNWRKLPVLPASAHYASAEAAKVFNLYVSGQNVLYMGTNDGVFSLDVSKIDKFLSEEAQLPDYRLVLDHVATWHFIEQEGWLYVASNKGLSRIELDKERGEFLFGLSDGSQDIKDNSTISLLIDRDGQFWLGSNATGVYLWDPSRELIENFSYRKGEKQGLSNNEVWHILQDSETPDLSWVATSNGLNLLDTSSHKIKHFLVNPDTHESFTQSHIYYMYQDKWRRLWLVTPRGVKLFDSEKEQQLDLPFSEEINELLSEEQYVVYLDRDNYLWSVTADKVVRISLDTSEMSDLSELSQGELADNIFNILGYLPDSSTLLISSNDSLWGYDTLSREVKRLYHHQDSSSSEMLFIDSWAIDAQGILWLGFSGKGLVGLALKDFAPKYYYHKGNSIIDNNVYGVMADAEGDIWFSSHGGLFLLDSASHHIRNFGPRNGFQTLEFNGGAARKLQDGRFAYGSMAGVSLFNPQVLKKSNRVEIPKVHVTRVEVLSRDYSSPMVLEDNIPVFLKYNDVGLRFSFSPLSYLNNQKIIYEYHLKGKEEVSYPPTTKNEITFPGLSSGRHVLEVRAKSPVTGRYSPVTRLEIKVSYAPWASPIAFLIYAVTVITLVMVWYLRRAVQRQRLLDAHEQVKYREKRLQLALTGSNSEVWDWQAENNLMFGKRIADELGYRLFASSYNFLEHVKLIHPDDKDSFLSSWRNYIENAENTDNFSCTYRLKSAEGDWLWYKDLGKVVAVDEKGRPTRITGSYTNITQSRADEERAQYYGDAFKQTKDWVLIISDNFERVTANQSLRDVFGWQDEEFKFDSSLLGLSKERRQFYRRLLMTLHQDSHWRGEELILTKSGEEYHVIININVSKNPNNNSLHYICVFTDITAQKAAEKELRYLANYDHLTELPNRSLLLERIKHAMDYSQRKSKSIALFFIDLDRFKQINDSLGHDYGDLLLKEVTSRLTQVLRVDDTIARIGGDEFVVLLESFRGNSQLAQIAQKIINAIEEPVCLNENMVSIGASIGIALYPEDASNSDELLRNADVAMYHAKQLGRNTFQFFTQRMNHEASARLQAESNLKLAHANNEFINHYQPVVDAITGKAIGVELLLRWQSKDGLIPPMSFIPIAEELNLIIAMTESAMARGLKDLTAWRELRPDIYLSVNLSAQHFIKEDLVPYITEILERFDLPAKALKLEVTETALISEPQKAINAMQALAKLGVKLALDDFGTGYSSLTYLKQLPLDILKIDRSFVSGIGTDKTDEAIVDATLVLAERLGMQCIAEGVETREQLGYLADHNCHLIQGYLYSKPVDTDTIIRYLTENKMAITAPCN